MISSSKILHGRIATGSISRICRQLNRFSSGSSIRSVGGAHALPLHATNHQQVYLFGLSEDRNSSFLQGPAAAPPIIIKELFSDAHNDFCELGYNVIKSVSVMDDIIPDHCDSESVSKAIDARIRHILQEKKAIPFILGGDHSISFPICRTIRKYRDKPFFIVHFDAHPDLYPDFEGNSSSHASPFARILEDKTICKGLVQIGIRTINSIQQEMIEMHKVSVCEARHFPPSSRYSSLSDLFRHITPEDDVYISLDMDVLDPAFAPGVSHREPGGLSTRQLINAIHAIPGNIIGADVVEYNPSRDYPGNFTATCAAKLAKEIMGMMLRP